MTLKRYTRALLLAAALATLGAGTQRAYAQGGSGSRGGMVMACFNPKVPYRTILKRHTITGYVDDTSDPTNPNKKKEVSIEGWTWPTWDRNNVDWEIYNAEVQRAAAALTHVEVDEYRDVLAGGRTGVEAFAGYDPVHRLHPIQFLLSQASFDLVSANRERRDDGGAPSEPSISQYFNDGFFDLTKEEHKFRPAMERLYWMMAEMFRGVPGFYMRLKAAHDKIKFLHYRETADGGYPIYPQYNDFVGVATHPMDHENCVWMKAVDRKSDENGNLLWVKYDPYLWKRMHLFQRVLLQFHEEFYYLGADVARLAIVHGRTHKDATFARSLLVGFLRGERGPNGGFAKTCASYEPASVGPNPGTVFTVDSTCRGLTPDAPSLRPGTIEAIDAKRYVKSFLCDEKLATCPKLDSWTTALSNYGGHTPQGLAGLIASNSFGKYRSHDELLELKKLATDWLDEVLGPYEKVGRFCDLGGYGTTRDTPRPVPATGLGTVLAEIVTLGAHKSPGSKRTDYIARRASVDDRQRKLLRGEISRDDYDQVMEEEAAHIQIQRWYNGVDQGRLLSLASKLVDDYPEGPMRREIRQTITEFKLGVNEIRDQSTLNSKTKGDLDRYCDYIRKRGTRLTKLHRFFYVADDSLPVHEKDKKPYSFESEYWGGHDTLLEAPVFVLERPQYTPPRANFYEAYVDPRR